MTLLLLSGVAVVPLLGAASGNVDVGNLLAAYGTAAPFAALCLWWVQQSRKDRDAAQAELAAARAETKQIRDESLARERELLGRFAPVLYDSALLYEKGNARLAEVPASLAQVELLTQAVQDLTKRMRP